MKTLKYQLLSSKSQFRLQSSPEDKFGKSLLLTKANYFILLSIKYQRCECGCSFYFLDINSSLFKALILQKHNSQLFYYFSFLIFNLDFSLLFYFSFLQANIRQTQPRTELHPKVRPTCSLYNGNKCPECFRTQ